MAYAHKPHTHTKFKKKNVFLRDGLYIALAILELTIYTRLTSNSTELCVSRAGVKGVCHCAQHFIFHCRSNVGQWDLFTSVAALVGICMASVRFMPFPSFLQPLQWQEMDAWGCMGVTGLLSSANADSFLQTYV